MAAIYDKNAMVENLEKNAKTYELEQAAKTYELLLNKVPGDPNICVRLGQVYTTIIVFVLLKVVVI